jgi:hypothetical protein
MTLYRFTNYNQGHGFVTEFGEYESTGHSVKICLHKLQVEKETPKGYRLTDGTWVSKDARKRYAYETIELAKESFIARKTRQIKLLSNQLKDAEQALNLINNYGPNETEASSSPER